MPSKRPPGSATLAEQKVAVRRPRMYRVVLHNDDFTTTDFVVYVLVMFFQRPLGEATRIMLQVHNEGMGIAGVYPREVAETKVSEVSAEAERQGMPLLVTAEPESLPDGQ